MPDGILYTIVTAVAPPKPGHFCRRWQVMVMIPDGDGPCGSPTVLRQMGHRGATLRQLSMQDLWKTWLHRMICEASRRDRGSWQTEHSVSGRVTDGVFTTKCP
jgi:hypothetical protein